jgi:predicted GTPase
MGRIPVIIMGAAGRDFHNFNVRFRMDPTYEVIAFTATQIPYITDKRFPPELAGPFYPNGIHIYDEKELPGLIKKFGVQQVYFSYSDVSYPYLMNRASICQAGGADFILMGGDSTMLRSRKPVISVCAVRTGCGKSQTTRFIGTMLKNKGLKVAAVRHPMPYGDLVAQKCQRFASIADLKKHNCTIEEMEEYEPHINAGILVFAGLDYAAILEACEKEVDVILWDGGNNDLPFFKPDLHVVVVDPHRVGHEVNYYPGEVNARLADIFVINKEDSATSENIAKLVESISKLSPKAKIVHADSKIILPAPEQIKGKRVLCVEDGPTLTHGEMKYGAAVVAAERFGAATIVDPRPWVVGAMKETFDKYTGIGKLIPAMGYSDQQVTDLEETINKVDCDVVLVGTPIDLTRLIKINKPNMRVGYDLDEKGTVLADAVNAFVAQRFGK